MGRIGGYHGRGDSRSDFRRGRGHSGYRSHPNNSYIKANLNPRRNVRLEPMKNVDRSEICPFLIRTFARVDEPFSLEDFQDGKFPEGEEVQVYAWEDITLIELTAVLGDISEEVRDAVFGIDYYLIQKNPNEEVTLKFIGYIRSDFNPVTSKKLHQFGFRIGDSIAVRIRNKSASDN